MTAFVYQMHNERKPFFAWPRIGDRNEWADTLCMGNKYRPTFLRQWRKHRDKSLVQVSELLHISHGQLSRIERGLQPYNQELLERLAELYMCEPVDLLMRDPSEPTNIWSLWDHAKPGEKRQIEAVAEALLRGRTGTSG
jgi:transcriptional regulator with XRE-family HTH domain